jgi:hypothetical protein
MTRPALRLTSADDMPAPRADDDSALVLEQALNDLSRLRTATGSATAASACTPWPASSTKPTRCSPRPSTTPATKNSPGPTSPSSSASRPAPQPGSDGNRHEPLDNDHPHNA